MKSYLKYLIMCVLAFSGATLFAQTLKISIHNIKTKTGQICIGIFSSQTEFKLQTPLKSYHVDKGEMVNGEMNVTIPFDTGRYGIAVFDDKNGNAKMDYNVLGIPREGFGFGNFIHRGFKMPLFDDFAFDLKHGETREVAVKLRYIL